MNGRVDRVAALFANAFGRRPAGVWAAPGRVNLIGEHTDYNDGFVLPFALDRSTLAAVALRDDGKARCVSAELGAGPEVWLAGVGPGCAPGGWSAYPLGVAWALAQSSIEVPGFDLLVMSDVPLGAGVSSSAALECCVALALADLAGAVVDSTDLALAAQRAENEVAGAPTGVMDQLVSMRARAGNALLLDCRSLQSRHIPFDPAAQGMTLLVIDTRTRHALVDGGYGQRRLVCEQAARLLGVTSLRDATRDSVEASRSLLGNEHFKRAWHVVTENARVLDAAAVLDGGAMIGVEGGAKGATGATGETLATGPGGDLGDLGPLLSAAHVSLRDFYEVSCPELDAVCESAEEGGAYGARMIGGGFGGSAIALVANGRMQAVIAAVTATAERRGFPKPSVFAAKPAEGAHRLG